MRDTIKSATTFTRTIVLNGKDILKLALGIPDTSDGLVLLALHTEDVTLVEPPTVWFQVPRGGDWSGDRIDIDDNNPVTIIVKYEKKQP